MNQDGHGECCPAAQAPACGDAQWGADTRNGGFVGNSREMAEALAMAADGKVKTVLGRLAKGQMTSRVVIDFSAPEPGPQPTALGPHLKTKDAP